MSEEAEDFYAKSETANIPAIMQAYADHYHIQKITDVIIPEDYKQTIIQEERERIVKELESEIFYSISPGVRLGLREAIKIVKTK